MIEIKEGEVTKILTQRPEITEVELVVDEKRRKGINYNKLTGPIEEGDKVVVNTTACSLDLGTGGYDFIIWIKGKERKLKGRGHIMKLRYTPYQLKTCSVSEKDCYQNKIKEFDSLAQTPVVIGSLHSMLAPITSMIKADNPEVKLTYIMTDGAALPIKFSFLVNYLKEEGLIDTTITIGHSFGGDLEAVNIYSGLIAGFQVAQADVIVVTMGPGIVGTGTKYGFSGTEQANLVHAAETLGGRVISVPRISFNDKRSRHFGISHHTRTNLGELIKVETLVGIPLLSGWKRELIEEQLLEAGIKGKHNILYREGEEVIEELSKLNIKVTTMGRSYKEAREYFMTAGIAGLIAKENLKEEPKG